MSIGAKIYVLVVTFIFALLVGYMLSWKMRLNQIDKNINEMRNTIEQQQMEYNQIRSKYVNELGGI